MVRSAVCIFPSQLRRAGASPSPYLCAVADRDTAVSANPVAGAIPVQHADGESWRVAVLLRPSRLDANRLAGSTGSVDELAAIGRSWPPLHGAAGRREFDLYRKNFLMRIRIRIQELSR